MYIIIAFVLFASLMGACQTAADDSDILGVNIEPNVLILLDSSGSMDDTVESFLYTASTTYPGSYSATAVYQQQSSSNHSLYASSISAVPDANAQNALATTGSWSGRIGGSYVRLLLGNYLNYQDCTSCTGTEKKIVIAKRVVSDLLRNTDGVRFGVMKFRSHGGEMVGPVGADTTTLINAVNAMSLTSVGTPLGDQLYDAGQYYKGLYSGHSSPIQLACQPQFVIMVSDGLHHTYNKDVRDEALNRYADDHASALTGTQRVIVHTVGFGIDASEAEVANDVLQEAARKGGGAFYKASNAAELAAGLGDAIRQVIEGTFAFAAPVVPTSSTTGSTHAYLTSFQTDTARPFWRGFLHAYQRDSSGQVPVDSSSRPLATALVWEAGQRLSQRAAADRNIQTVVNGGMVAFVKSSVAITETVLGVPDATTRDRVMDFIRGLDAFDADADADVTEERDWKLGDIFHSTPVLISPPFLPLTDADYVAFKQANTSRTSVLVVGANDGMLHAFRESDGVELWAFIPPDLLPRLQDLTGQSGDHPYYVDASPIAADILIGGQWRTVVVFGERRGGRGYHALDVTDPTAPTFLWSFTDPKMGETWSEPAIGKVELANGTQAHVAFVGGGYDTEANNATGNAFFVLDMATGQKLWEYTHDGAIGDHQFMNFSVAAPPTAIDLDNDRLIDRVYLGDVGGQLWRFDVGPGMTWAGRRLWAADAAQANPPAAGEYYPAQAIYVAPSATLDQSGNLWLFFGTGDRNHPNHATANFFYGILDKDTTVETGWTLALGSDEKVLSAADVFNHIVFFSTFTPTSTVSCETSGGTAKLYAVQIDTGYAALNFSTGGLLASSSSSTTRYHAVGSGIPSKPLVVLKTSSGPIATPMVIVGTTSQELASTSAPALSLRQILSWRDVY